MKNQLNRHKERILRDSIFGWMIKISGFLVLATFTTLVVHIIYNASPLFYAPKFQYSQDYGNINASQPHAPILVENEWVFPRYQSCQLSLTSLTKNLILKNFDLDLCHDSIALKSQSNSLYLIGFKNAAWTLYEITGNSLSIIAELEMPSTLELELTKSKFDFSISNNILFVSLKNQKDVFVAFYDLEGASIKVSKHFSNVNSVHTLLNNSRLFVHTENQYWLYDMQFNVVQKLDIQADNAFVQVAPSSKEITLVSDSSELIKYSFVNQDGEFNLVQNFGHYYDFKYFDSKPVFESNLSKRVKGIFSEQQSNALIVVLDDSLFIFNSISGEKLAQYRLSDNIEYAYYSDEQILFTSSDQFNLVNITQLQGVVTLSTMFNKHIYSGYDSSNYIWQSTAISNVQGPKFSLTPLIIGSIKAALLALIVAIPTAFGGAIYTAYFAPRTIRNIIKPSIEMLEAVPSVVIGFVAAIWLAPIAEKYWLPLVFSIFAVPLIIMMFAFLHAFLHIKTMSSMAEKMRLLLVLVCVIFSIAIVFSLSSGVFSDTNDFEPVTGLSKSAIIVSIALGLAISPTIFSLIDDAIYQVPEGVKQASFALGASATQTLFKVVLVVALPSIISAIMLGFGRAFGETMIVMMVTGNTPIANWDVFSSLRSLTANITIEMPDAQPGSALYHVLFFSAAILFAFTFIINTIASLLKRKIRDESGRV